MTRCLACSHWAPWSSWRAQERMAWELPRLRGGHPRSLKRPEFLSCPCRRTQTFQTLHFLNQASSCPSNR